MSKRAQLADGTILEFPDDTPDNVMDTTVQSHIRESLPPLASRQAASKAEFEKNLPPPLLSAAGIKDVVSRYGSPNGQPEGLMDKVSRLTHAVFNTPGEEKLNTAIHFPFMHNQLPNGTTLPPADTGNAPTRLPGLDLVRDAFAGAGPASVTTATRSLIPTTTHAGENFQKVMRAARDFPLDTVPLHEIINRAQELEATGSTLPKVLTDLTDALKNGEDIPYSQGRDFAANAGRLSTSARQEINPPMAAQVKRLAAAMDTANRGAAAQAGVVNMYDNAMSEYRNAMRLRTGLKYGLKYGVPLAIGGGVIGGTLRRLAPTP